jgi:hypothetical protein
MGAKRLPTRSSPIRPVTLGSSRCAPSGFVLRNARHAHPRAPCPRGPQRPPLVQPRGDSVLCDVGAGLVDVRLLARLLTKTDKLRTKTPSDRRPTDQPCEFPKKTNGPEITDAASGLWTTLSGFESLPPSHVTLHQQQFVAVRLRSLDAVLGPCYRPLCRPRGNR